MPFLVKIASVVFESAPFLPKIPQVALSVQAGDGVGAGLGTRVGLLVAIGAGVVTHADRNRTSPALGAARRATVAAFLCSWGVRRGDTLR